MKAVWALGLLTLAWITPLHAAPEGTLTWGVHVSLATRWLDPAETEAVIIPFMLLYALHAAPGRVVDDVEGRAHVRLHAAQRRQIPQRGRCDGRGRQVLLRALSRRGV